MASGLALRIGNATTPYVVIAPGTPSERGFPINGRLYVGRECQGIDDEHRLLVSDARVSRLHLEITVAGDGSAWVTDRSANGTKLNGQMLPVTGPVMLVPGDRLGLGVPELEYRTPVDYVQPPPDGNPYFVEIREPDQPIRLRIIEGPLEIGRDCPGEIVRDRLVSRSHLKFVPRPGSLMVADLGGRNGTMLNGVQLIRPATVRPGDVLRIGQTDLMILSAQPRGGVETLGPQPVLGQAVQAPASPVFPPAPMPRPAPLPQQPQPAQQPQPMPRPGPAPAPVPMPVPEPAHGAGGPAPHIPGAPPHPAPPAKLSGGIKFGAILAALVVVAISVFGFSMVEKLAELQSNDPKEFLPSDAESTQIIEVLGDFSSVTTLPGFVVFERAGGLTDTDQQAIAAAREEIIKVPGIDAETAALAPVEISADNTTASISAPMITRKDGVDSTVEQQDETQQAVLEAAKAAGTDGLAIHTAGPAALFVASNTAFAELDAPLLFTTLGVVVVILLLVYRSPTLLFVPLLSAALAIGFSSLVVYLLAENDLVTLTGIAQAILSVLILGAGTDYALLLIARYREELYKHENRFVAMFVAWKHSAEAIVASAGTASAGLLCLIVSDLNLNKGLGPIAAAGIGATLTVMMTVLPVVLALLGRWIFWPNIPRPSKIDALGKGGTWGKISDVVVRHRRAGWVGSTVLLLMFLVGITSLDASGLTGIEQLRKNPDAVVGSKLYDEKFPDSQGSGSPALILTNASEVDAVIEAARGVDGVSTAGDAVCVFPDREKLLAAQQSGAAPEQAEPACFPPELQVDPVDDRIIVYATLTSPMDSPEALDTIERLRTTVGDVNGAEAVIGGGSAEVLDIKNATIADRNLVIPLVLFVIFCILVVLLRSIAAPILLISTVVLSFAATLGVSALVFDHVFGFAAADQNFPLFAFVFLVALGVDYNIFLMTRVRQEALLIGTRSGIRRALTVTGGVITSAGVVLAATFAVLCITPLVVLAEVGFAVAFGVLLDTLIVRTILVPALAHEIGRSIWWPSKLRKGMP